MNEVFLSQIVPCKCSELPKQLHVLANAKYVSVILAVPHTMSGEGLLLPAKMGRFPAGLNLLSAMIA